MKEDIEKAEAYWANLRGQVDITLKIAKKAGAESNPRIGELVAQLAQVLEQAVNALR
jgi:hypothetical protein